MDRQKVISVRPVDGGWSVEGGFFEAPLMFLSGGRAEEKARSLAQLLARQGQDVRVVVHDRRNTLIGAVNYVAGP